MLSLSTVKMASSSSSPSLNAQLTREFPTDAIVTIGKNLYLNDEMADFHFIFKSVIGESEHIPAHKLLLVTVSDVFRTMFNDTWYKKDEVEIVDASAGAFREFLQFFYLDRATVTMSHVAKVMYLGDKYNVTKCLEVCDKFIINALDENSVCSALELGIFFNRPNITKCCDIFIGINTQSVLASDGFLKCNSKVLSHIVKLDSLSCKEIEVFKACMNWVKATAQVDQLTHEVVQDQLGEMLYDIRFKSMTYQDFATLLPVYGKLFSTDEYQDISQAIALREFQPTIFTTKLRESFKYRRWNESSIYCDRFLKTELSRKPYLIQSEEEITFSVNQPLLLRAVECGQLFTCDGEYFCEIPELPTKLSIVEIGDSGVEMALSDEDALLQCKDTTTIRLTKPTLVRPGFKYQIRLKQTPPLNCCSFELLKLQVQMAPNVTVQFYRDPTKEHDNTTRGIVSGLIFDRICD